MELTPSSAHCSDAAAGMAILDVYIAASFRHMHGAQLLGRELERLGCHILDWTVKATPPPGLTPAQRRQWMDTDQAGGQVYDFCRNACLNADLVIYYGASGQDAGVEIGLAAASGAPVLGILGPLEAPGLMLHGAVTAWVNSAPHAVDVMGELVQCAASDFQQPPTLPAAQDLLPLLRERKLRSTASLA